MQWTNAFEDNSEDLDFKTLAQASTENSGSTYRYKKAVVIGDVGQTCYGDLDKIIQLLHSTGIYDHVFCYESVLNMPMTIQSLKICSNLRKNLYSYDSYDMIAFGQGGLSARYLYQACTQPGQAEFVELVGTPNMGVNYISMEKL